MKVLVVSNGYPPRGRFGTEFYTRELVRGLAAAGDEVSVLHPERGGGRPRYELEPVVEEGVAVTLLHNPGDPRRRFATSYADEHVEAAFTAHLATLRPDLVHFTYLLWGLSVRLPRVAAVLGIPSVVTLTDYGLLCHRGQMFDAALRPCHGPHPPDVCARCIRTPTPHDHAGPVRAIKRLAAEGLAAVGGLGLVPTTAALTVREGEVRATLESVARLVAPTRSLARVFESAGVPRARIAHLPYAFDEAPYRAVRTAPAPEVPRFGFLGQLAPHKDPATLLEAAARLERERPDVPFEVVLYGTPSAHRARGYWPAAWGARSTTRAVLGEPFEPGEAPRVLAGLTALVLPSLWDENAPLALLQARAAGVPIVASDVPGAAEVLPAEPHGRLFPPGDAAALAEALGAVLDGKLRRDPEGRLPQSLDEHVREIRAIHRAARAAGGG